MSAFGDIQTFGSFSAFLICHKSVCVVFLDHRARAKAWRCQHPCVGEEQEGVHRTHGEVEDRERSCSADRELGARLL